MYGTGGWLSKEIKVPKHFHHSTIHKVQFWGIVSGIPNYQKHNWKSALDMAFAMGFYNHLAPTKC